MVKNTGQQGNKIYSNYRLFGSKPRQTSYYSNYAQQKRYWAINGFQGHGKDKFRTDLLDFIRLRKYKGDKIIFILDENENMQTGKMAKELLQKPYNMTGSIRGKVGNMKFPTWYRCQRKLMQYGYLKT